jgi:hypothetical protein
LIAEHLPPGAARLERPDPPAADPRHENGREATGGRGAGNAGSDDPQNRQRRRSRILWIAMIGAAVNAAGHTAPCTLNELRLNSRFSREPILHSRGTIKQEKGKVGRHAAGLTMAAPPEMPRRPGIPDIQGGAPHLRRRVSSGFHAAGPWATGTGKLDARPGAWVRQAISGTRR